MAKYHVICHRPGLFRGGKANPSHAAYESGDHSADELSQLLAEPLTQVIVGDELTEDGIPALIAPRAKSSKA